MKNKKLKALDILNILLKENFKFERYSTDKKPAIIDKTVLTEAINELKEIKKCDNCRHLNKNIHPNYTSATLKECEYLNIKLYKIDYCSGWSNV